MKEALKLALEALETIVDAIYINSEQEADAVYKVNDAITAIKAALAQPTSGDYALGYVEGFNDACMPKPAQQEPVAWVTKRNVIVDGLWEEEITFSEFDDGGDPVYYTPPQRTEERNFCSRCGKRTADLTVIHTCTPPQPEQEPVAWATRMGEYAHIHWGAKRPEYPMVYEAPLYTTPPQQEPVAMKFKIYKPTVPDPMRQGINNALLPWVYDQDRSSGFDASMWVTPVATLPPQRKPLTRGQIREIEVDVALNPSFDYITPAEQLCRAIEAAHGIKE